MKILVLKETLTTSQMKRFFHILGILCIFITVLHADNGVKSVYYSALRDDILVFRSSNFRVNQISIASLMKNDVVKIVDSDGELLKVELKNGKQGFVKKSDFVKVSELRSSMMSEIEILSQLDELDGFFIYVDDESRSVNDNKRLKYLKRDFMTEEFLVNLDIFEIERLIRIKEFKRR